MDTLSPAALNSVATSSWSFQIAIALPKLKNTFLNDTLCAPTEKLTFKAIELGLIGSLDEPILRWAPEIGNLNADLGYKDRAITFRHLLNQTSGYGLAEKPGEAFAYNDFATGLLV